MTLVHPTAIVDKSAHLDENVTVGPYCLVGDGAVIGRDTVLRSHVVVDGNVSIGSECIFYPFSVVGCRSQHLGCDGIDTFSEIGDRVVLRENVVVSRGTKFGDRVTRVGSDTYVMSNSHVSHDCQVGNNVLLSHDTAMAGHVSVGDYVVIGATASVHQWVRIGTHAMIAAAAPIGRDIAPYTLASRRAHHLEGINVLGLRRRKFSTEVIKALREVYNLLSSATAPTLAERITLARTQHGEIEEVSHLLDFLKTSSKRGIAGFSIAQDRD